MVRTSFSQNARPHRSAVEGPAVLSQMFSLEAGSG
jgi:hypothetical protein